MHAHRDSHSPQDQREKQQHNGERDGHYVVVLPDPLRLGPATVATATAAPEAAADNEEAEGKDNSDTDCHENGCPPHCKLRSKRKQT